MLEKKICRLTDVPLALFFYANPLNSWKQTTTTTEIRFCNYLNLFLADQMKMIDTFPIACSAIMQSVNFLIAKSVMQILKFALAFQKLLCINLGSADVHTVRLLYKFSQFVNVPHVQKHSICSCIKCNRICICICPHFAKTSFSAQPKTSLVSMLEIRNWT